MRFLTCLIILLSWCNFQAQDISYAREVVDTLTSPHFAGRGVIKDGERKAADYVANQFEKLGLKPVTESYFQEFSYPINTFQKNVDVFINGASLKAGKDFLIDPTSCAEHGEFKVINCIPSSKKLKRLVDERFFRNKFIFINDEITENEELFEKLIRNDLMAAGVIVIKDKLTHRISTTQSDFVTIQLNRASLVENPKTIKVDIDQEFIPNYKSQNVIAKIDGSEYPDSIIIFSAHYDHLGGMGNEVFFPGANDNASGVAMLLNLVKHYTSKEPPAKTHIFIAFGAEESGLIGSKYFTENPTIDLNKINFVLNLDLMGTGSEGIQVVNGKVFTKHFEKLASINQKNNYLTKVKTRGKAANSDHYWFSERGIPAFFIYTLGGIKAYHDIYDISETLPLTKFEDCFRLFRDFVEEL